MKRYGQLGHLRNKRTENITQIQLVRLFCQSDCSRMHQRQFMGYQFNIFYTKHWLRLKQTKFIGKSSN